MTTKRAGAVIIGDEILSGKVRDVNSNRLIQTLKTTSFRLQTIITVGDNREAIGKAVRECSEKHDSVFTSGGVGPTHDDLTVASIAQAFDKTVVRDPILVEVLRQHLGDRANEAALKMAEVPEGAVLITDGPFPIISFRNIYILPGVPEIFAAQLQLLKPRFGTAAPVVHRLYLRAKESEIAEALRKVAELLPAVQIGSYPRYRRSDYQIMITVEATDLEPVQRAIDRLRAVLPPEIIVDLVGDDKEDLDSV